MKTSRILGATCACLLSITITPLQAATVIYEYVGVPFDAVDGSIYQGGQKVTATSTLASKLAEGAGCCAPVSFSLNDEEDVITNFTATDSSFWFDTNASGDILRWQFFAEIIPLPSPPYPADTGHSIGSYHIANYTTEGGYGYYFNGADWLVGAGGEYFNNTSAALYGTWTATVVPIPATVWLFGSGLLGMIGIARRKKVA